MTSEERINTYLGILKTHLDKGKGKQRFTDYETDARNRLIYELIVSGMSRVRVAQFVSDKLNVAPKTAYDWIKTATKTLFSDNEEYRQNALQIQIDRLSEIAATGNDKNKLAALDQISKLLGLYQTKVEVETNRPIEFSFS